MKLILSLILVSIGLVAAKGAWKEGKVYKYNFEAYAGNNKEGTIARARLTILPQSGNVLIGKITHDTLGKTNQLFSGDISELNKVASEYNEWPLDKRFKIHLENGVIKSLSVDSETTTSQLNQLKAVVSQLQVNTNTQNLIQADGNHAPKGKKALYRVMEPTLFGKCETTYDIEPLSNYLLNSHAEWAPVPSLKRDGDFIKIQKTSNFRNCVERGDMQSESKSDEKYPVALTRIVISDDLNDYTIQSSYATITADNFFEYIGLTLESADDPQVAKEIDGNLVRRVKSNDKVTCSQGKENLIRRVNTMTRPQGKVVPMRSGTCEKAADADVQWSSCTSLIPSNDVVCIKEFSDEWEGIDWKSCGFLFSRKTVKCRKSYPGCRFTGWIDIGESDECDRLFGGNVPILCGGLNNRLTYRARCCPKSYE